MIVNGKKGVAAIYVKAKAGKDILLDASRSKDAEGDELSFSWWQQTEASSFHSPVVIEGASTSKARIHLPEQSKGKELHIICEVHDNGAFHLVSYRRIIIQVK